MTRSFTPAALALACALASPLASVTAFAQDEPTEAAVDLAPPGLRLGLKLDWIFFTSLGAGGGISVEWDQWEVGALGFATPLNPFFRDLFLANADDLDVPLNWGVELYARYYLEPDRHWLFVDGLISFDGFRLSPQSGSDQWLYALYVAPRVGLRIPLGSDYLLFEPSVGAALRVVETRPEVAGAVRTTQPIAPLLFLTLSGSIPLS